MRSVEDKWCYKQLWIWWLLKGFRTRLKINLSSKTIIVWASRGWQCGVWGPSKINDATNSFESGGGKRGLKLGWKFVFFRELSVKDVMGRLLKGFWTRLKANVPSKTISTDGQGLVGSVVYEKTNDSNNDHWTWWLLKGFRTRLKINFPSKTISTDGQDEGLAVWCMRRQMMVQTPLAAGG